MKKRHLHLIFLSICLIFSIGCTQDIPFETIIHSRGGHHYEGKNPDVFLIWEAEGLKIPNEYIDQKTKDKLKTFDFSQSFILAIFQGQQTVIHEGITIEKVERDGDKIVVFAQAGPIADFSLDAYSSPCHIISLPKSEKPSPLHFEININDEIGITIIE